MTIPPRRRGGQPGNQNACKHGLYRQKPAPGNQNARLHSRSPALLSPTPGRQALLRYRADLTPAAPPLHSQPPGWLDDRLSRLEAELLAPHEDACHSFADLIDFISALHFGLELLLREMSRRAPFAPPPPERKLP